MKTMGVSSLALLSLLLATVAPAYPQQERRGQRKDRPAEQGGRQDQSKSQPQRHQPPQDQRSEQPQHSQRQERAQHRNDANKRRRGLGSHTSKPGNRVTVHQSALSTGETTGMTMTRSTSITLTAAIPCTTAGIRSSESRSIFLCSRVGMEPHQPGPATESSDWPRFVPKQVAKSRLRS
jgi:hypothetical protein